MNNFGEDLRSWIEHARQLGLVKDVKGADRNLEIGVITELNAKKKGPSMLFDDIVGYQSGFRVLTGSMIDSRRVALSLGLSVNIGNLGLVAALRDRLVNASQAIKDFPPEYVSQAPLMQNVRKGDDVNMLIFPAPKWHEHDGGFYIGTADCVITKDPDRGWINIGAYRVMVHSKNELGILVDTGHHARLHYRKYIERKQQMPIAISFGHHPLLFAVAGVEVPAGVSEYNYAGALVNASWPVLSGAVTGLPIPADSEIAIEGLLTDQVRDEGPFGEFLGYYAGGVMKNPVIKVEALYYRDDPIILGTAPGKPPYDYSYYRCPIRAAMIWDILERAGIPNVRGVWCHEEGYSRAFTVVSIKQAYSGHARQAGLVAAQCRPGAYTGRFTIVVDEDIDPSNLQEVIWALCSRTDPATGIEIIRNTWSGPLDPLVERTSETNPEESSGSIAVIFAVKPYKRILDGTFPEVVQSSQDIVEKTKMKWKNVLSL